MISQSKKTWGRILKIVLALIILIFCIDRARKDTDFDVYLEAAKVLLSGGDIFDEDLTLDVQYFYSPFFALILVPFSFLPAFIVKLAWLLLNVFFIYRIWVLLSKYLDQSVLTIPQKKLLVFIPHIILVGFIIDNFHMAQVTFFILWATLESIRLIFYNRMIAGAILLGIVINIKLLPLPIILYLIYRNHWKAAFATFCVAVVLLFVPAIFIGIDYNSFLLESWWRMINPTKESFTLETNLLTFNLPALITALFIENREGEKILEIPYSTLERLIMTARIIFVIITLFFLGTLPFRKAPSRLHQFREIAYILLATVLLFPQQNKYANVYLLPALTYIAYFLLVQFRSNRMMFTSPFYIFVCVLLFISIAFMCLTGKSIVGDELSVWLGERKAITFGTILLVPVMLLLRPSKLII